MNLYICAVLDDRLNSVISNVYKGKGDGLERGIYKGIKLSDQIMKSCGGFAEERVDFCQLRERRHLIMCLEK